MKYEEAVSRCWAEIDVDALLENYRTARGMLAPECELICVLKANAYGVGARQVAKLLRAEGAKTFAVACVSEAEEVLDEVPDADVLVLGLAGALEAERAIRRGILLTAFSENSAATIAAASESLSTMVSNILRLNKLENQEITPNAAPYDLTRQLCDCALTHEARWEAKNIDFDAQLEERVMVLADEAMMEIVFNNLISNAIKFTEAGGRILLRQVKDGDQVVVTVADTGCGMDEATLGRIFDKFYQGDTSHSKEGNGLGLALVRRVLEISGGSISVTSAPGEGSEFTVRLPRMAETA